MSDYFRSKVHTSDLIATFDDVLILPGFTDFAPSDVDLSSDLLDVLVEHDPEGRVRTVCCDAAEARSTIGRMFSSSGVRSIPPTKPAIPTHPKSNTTVRNNVAIRQKSCVFIEINLLFYLLTKFVS